MAIQKTYPIDKLIGITLQRYGLEKMDDKLVERINQFNKIKYGSNDNEIRIVFTTLKPDVTIAPNTKGVTA